MWVKSRNRHRRSLADGMKRELEWHMAAMGRAAFVGGLVWISAPGLASAQSWAATTVAQADPARPQTKARPKPTTTGQAAAPSSAKTRKPGESLALDDN